MPTIDNLNFDLQAFLLCDTCLRDVQTGKTSVQGIFDRIFAHSFPCVHQQSTIYFRFAFDSPPTIPIDVAFTLITPAGLRNTSPSTRLNIPSDALTAEGYVTVQGLQFPEPGRYIFELVVNGHAIGDYTVTLEQIGGSSGRSNLLN
jgi:Family of unknown function (DUF6941)